MANVVTVRKACTVNPLKMSQPIGGALAFLGLNNCMPVLHGSQGCTGFGLVLVVRHFREANPLQTTAMNEATTIMGGCDNIEQAILNICNRTKREIIGICSTGLTETKGDDVEGYLKLIRQRHPELDHVAIVYVSTPDYTDAFQDGWSKAVVRLVEELVPERKPPPAPPFFKGGMKAGAHIAPSDTGSASPPFEKGGMGGICKTGQQAGI